LTEQPQHHDASSSAARAIDPARRPSARAIALQILGFALSVALVVWAVRLAMSKGDAEQLAKLASPPTVPLLVLLGATLASISVNGLIFATLVRPIRKLPAGELIAVNAIATFLSVLPFKLGLLARVVIHTRRDNLPLRDIVSWFASVAGVTLAVLLPLTAITLWRQQADAIWALSGLLLVPASCVIVVVGARFVRSTPKLKPLALGADRILTQRSAVARAGVLRAIDTALLATRFAAAAAIIGVSLDADSAVVLGSTYFLVSVLAPTGATGFQLGGTITIAAWEALPVETAAILALAVAISEFGVALIMATIGAIALRLDRLLR
jgi:hypothetical protein